VAECVKKNSHAGAWLFVRIAVIAGLTHCCPEIRSHLGGKLLIRLEKFLLIGEIYIAAR
jgi:hypothetical protein